MAIPHIKVRSQNSFHIDISREIASLEGHLFALPILFINLGGEMIYIIEHRLRAQKLDSRIDKVMHDVIGTIFRPRIIDELFKPQHLLSEASMRSLFRKLAHASIMSLNQESMDKLLDLMSMTVKYQVFACTYPSEMVFCTLNHLDYMRDLVKHVDPISNSLRKVYNYIDRTYCRMDNQNLILLRSAILRYFQDRKTRLTVFLNSGIQRECDGMIKIPRDQGISPHSQTNLPGKIIYYKSVKNVLSTETTESHSASFATGANYIMTADTLQTTAFDTNGGNRGTTLGTNIFALYKGGNVTAPAPETPFREAQVAQPAPITESLTHSSTGTAEINMLMRILGGVADSHQSDSTSIELDFLDDDTPSGNAKAIHGQNRHETVRVELIKSKLQDIDLGINEASTEPQSSSYDDMDLLQLMDEASKSA